MKGRFLIPAIAAFLIWACEDTAIDPDSYDFPDSTDLQHIIDSINYGDSSIVPLPNPNDRLDTGLLFRSWYTEDFNFGFTLFRDGSIEFLQWNLAEGRLVFPFEVPDAISLNFADSTFTLDLVNCIGGGYVPLNFEEGKLLELTEEKLVINGFILDAPFMEFEAIDLETYVRPAYNGDYSVAVTTGFAENAEDTWKLINSFVFDMPDIAQNTTAEAKWNQTDQKLTFHLEHHMDGPCILGSSNLIYLTITLTNFDGVGEYPFDNTVEVEYSQVWGDAIESGEITEGHVKITELNTRTQTVIGTFGFAGRIGEFRFKAEHGNFELPVEVLE